jgi:hypothetical protein
MVGLRLKSAARCLERGYLVGFHFDPVILHPGWEEKYRAVVRAIYASLDPERIMWISIGGFRYPKFLKPIIRDRFPRPSEHFWHRILPASTIIMVSLVFLFAIVAWSEPLPGAGSSGSNSPQMMLAASTNLQTPLPTHPPVLSPTSTSNISEELLANPTNDGLVPGGIVQIIIILGGTLASWALNLQQQPLVNPPNREITP